MHHEDAPNSAVITPDEVERVARLARLSLNDDEKDGMQSSLASILSYIKRLEELDVSSIEATAHAVELSTAWRDDAVVQGIGSTGGLQNAPEPIANGFGVPKIIE